MTVTIVLGVLTALAVSAWGIHWYLGEREQQQRMARRARAVQQSQQAETAASEEEAGDPSLPSSPQVATLPATEGMPERVAEPEGGTLPQAALPPDVEQLPGGAPGAGEDETPVTGSGEGEDLSLEKKPPSAPLASETSVPQEKRLSPDEEFQGYCARCRAKRYLSNPTFIRTRRGKPAIHGNCVICGSGMLVFTTDEAGPIEAQGSA